MQGRRSRRRLVQDIGLPAGHLLDVRGIDEQAGDGLLEHVEHRLPVHSRALHRDVRDLVGLQLIAQPQQLGRRGPEGPHVLLTLLQRPRHTSNTPPRYPDAHPTRTLARSTAPWRRLPSCLARTWRSFPRHDSARRARITATMLGAESSHVRLTTDSLDANEK